MHEGFNRQPAVGIGGICNLGMWVGEAFNLGKFMLLGDLRGCGTVGDLETTGKFIGSKLRGFVFNGGCPTVSNFNVDGLFGVGGNFRPRFLRLFT